jgi:hypothetical protein
MTWMLLHFSHFTSKYPSQINWQGTQLPTQKCNTIISSRSLSWHIQQINPKVITFTVKKGLNLPIFKRDSSQEKVLRMFKKLFTIRRRVTMINWKNSFWLKHSMHKKTRQNSQLSSKISFIEKDTGSKLGLKLKAPIRKNRCKEQSKKCTKVKHTIQMDFFTQLLDCFQIPRL